MQPLRENSEARESWVLSQSGYGPKTDHCIRSLQTICEAVTNVTSDGNTMTLSCCGVVETGGLRCWAQLSGAVCNRGSLLL